MKYKIKNKIIEAFQFGIDYMPDWFMNSVTTKKIIILGKTSGVETAYINTCNGTIQADRRDFIIKGTDGEIFTCKPDLFNYIYDIINENDNSASSANMSMKKLHDTYGAEIGIRLTCKRCGKQAFRKQIGYNTINAANENRHSMLDEFEPVPDGWEIKHDLGGWHCPDCIKEYNSILDNFKNIKKLDSQCLPLNQRSTEELIEFRHSFLCSVETANEIDKILQERRSR